MNEEKKASSAPQTNLLKNRFFSWFIKSWLYPAVFQWITAAVFIIIVYQLLVGPLSAHDNFGTAATWVLWWPLIPIIFLLLGRFWCAICPFGTLNDLVQKFVGNNRPVPKFLKKYGIWVIDAMFILITWSDHIWGIVESPRGSGVLLLLITTGVVVSGALWQRRTWCRHLCFLGGLSGNYSRSGMLELRATPEKCSKCNVAACFKGNDKVPGCPMFEFPRTMDNSAECNLCGYCVKTCPNDSIRITPRIPTKELWFVTKPRLEVSFLAIVIMGIVFVQNITMLEIWKEILAWLEKVMGTSSYYVTFTITFIIAMLIPIGLLVLASYISGLSNKDSVLQNFAMFGYAIIPLDMAGHIAHNLFHLLAEGKAVFYTAMGLFGMEGHAASAAILDNATIQVLQFILIGLGVAGSLYTAYRITKSNYGSQNKLKRIYLPYALLMLLLGAINIYLFMLPMEMRM